MSLLDRFKRSERASDLHTGPGASVFKSAFGRMVRFRPTLASFDHPWLATLDGDSGATFLQGMVNGKKAMIAGIPLDGGPKQKVPVLRWKNLQLDADGLGWLCVEVTCSGPDDKGHTPWSVLAAEMVQVGDPNTDDGKPDGIFHMAAGGAKPLKGNRARWPVAMIQRREGGSLDLFQIVHFNLTHRVALQKDGKSAQRHFFF
ncbi:MAG: hypothetical protein WCF18_09600 [Chthoniobacteraceae bacterium]